MRDSQQCARKKLLRTIEMTENASLFTREINFKLLLTGLIILMLTGPVMQEYASLDNPELLEIIFGGSIMLFVASLAGNMRVFWLGLILAAIALGGVTGSMTSGAALSVVTDAAQSNVPALGYTGAYAFANVILTLAGTLIMLL